MEIKIKIRGKSEFLYKYLSLTVRRKKKNPAIKPGFALCRMPKDTLFGMASKCYKSKGRVHL